MLKAKEKKKKKGGFRSSNFQIYTLMTVPLLWLFIFSYLPMFGVIISFKNYRYDLGILKSPWVGLENFKFLVLSNDFLKIVRNTVCMNLLFIAIGTVAALFAAICFFSLKSRTGVKVYQTVITTPNFVSWVVAGYITYALFQPGTGMLNNIFKEFGMKEIDWYNTPSVWPAILCVANVWKNVGMDCIIYYAALMGVDDSLLEAAELDGAGRFKKVWHVMIPTIIPVIGIKIILAVGGILNADFGLFYQLTRDSGSLYEVTDVLSTYIYRTMRVIGDMGLSSAAGLLTSFVGMILVIVVNYAAKKIDGVGGLF